MSLCTFFSSSLQSPLRLIGSPAQTQGKSQECYLLLSHHIKGMFWNYSSWECVTDICFSQLPSCDRPSADSRKTERKCAKERGRNNEAWVQWPQQAFRLPVANMSLDDNIIVHLTHVVGVCCLTGWEESWDSQKHKRNGSSMCWKGSGLCFL